MTTIRRKTRVAVLGAGIMGSCLALCLARRGVAVSLYDMEVAPMYGASRWNEGKIHLGYLYGADKQLTTARHLIPSGLAFAPLMRGILEEDLDVCTTEGDDIFLIHRDSVVGAEQARDYYRAVSKLVREAPGAQNYLVDVCAASCTELTSAELAELANPRHVAAGFRIPERSVETGWIADRTVAALESQGGISLRMSTRVSAVQSVGDRRDRWRVCHADGGEEFDCVVNALWQNRIDIDATVGLDPPAEWSKRYRLALFVHTARPLNTPSAVLAVGPFGDVKNYNGRDFYLSWYPAGLVHECDNTEPGEAFTPSGFVPDAIVAATRRGLDGVLAGAGDILDAAARCKVAGGWVFAQGRGSLASRSSSLHRRDRFGICRHGSYYSVDTGKYSLAPWLAASLSEEIAGV